MSIFLFAGPSLLGADVTREALADIKLRPPARYGDIRLLCDSEVPGIIALADGTFYDYPAVSHSEIRFALKNDWRVIGLCSMGAIRSAELHMVGMEAFGVVANRFCTDSSLADDEVALLHSNEEPFIGLSEPLLHIRNFLEHATVRNLIHNESSLRVLDYMQQQWFGNRTLSMLRSLLSQENIDCDKLKLLNFEISDFKKYRLKQLDLSEFIMHKRWLLH